MEYVQFTGGRRNSFHIWRNKEKKFPENCYQSSSSTVLLEGEYYLWHSTTSSMLYHIIISGTPKTQVTSFVSINIKLKSSYHLWHVHTFMYTGGYPGWFRPCRCVYKWRFFFRWQRGRSDESFHGKIFNAKLHLFSFPFSFVVFPIFGKFSLIISVLQIFIVNRDLNNSFSKVNNKR